MTQAKHTPGPWHVMPSGDAVQLGTRYVVSSSNPEYPISRADAALIAAAPDTAAERNRLRELLRELRDDVAKLKWGQSWPGRNHALMDRVDAALAKAGG